MGKRKGHDTEGWFPLRSWEFAYVVWWKRVLAQGEKDGASREESLKNQMLM